MRIQVRKCPFTGKIFEEKDIGKYLWHLKVLRDQQKEERLHQRLRDEFKGWLQAERAKVQYVADIIPWFIANQRQLMDAANAISLNSRYDKKYARCFMPEDRFANLKFENVRYDPLISNSHECPDNGVLNWNEKDLTKPTSYPGWRGYIRGSLIRNPKHDYSYPYGDALKIAGIKTGSGGGGNKGWGYDFRIFLDDWPGLQQEITEMEYDLMIKKIKGK